MRRYPAVLICSLLLLPVTPSHGQKSETFCLSGTDKDHTVMWDFFCTGGRRSGKWDKIAVPSCRELQGFGTFNYGRDKNPSDDLFLHFFTPEKPRFAAGSVTPEFPRGSISVLNGISSIGTKFSKPEDMGPQSQKNINILNRDTEPLKGVIYIRFGD